MAILSSKTTVSTIEKRSNNILGIFQKTILDLSEINAQINEQTELKKQEIEKLTAETEYLSKIMDKHEKVITKISDLLS